MIHTNIINEKNCVCYHVAFFPLPFSNPLEYTAIYKIESKKKVRGLFVTKKNAYNPLKSRGWKAIVEIRIHTFNKHNLHK